MANAIPPFVSGLNTIDFGAFPGSAFASTFVAFAMPVPATVSARLSTVATADHSTDEHIVETIKISATFEQGVGITLYGTAPGEFLLTGLWSVAWIWG